MNMNYPCSYCSHCYDRILASGFEEEEKEKENKLEVCGYQVCQREEPEAHKNTVPASREEGKSDPLQMWDCMPTYLTSFPFQALF